jgi:hypothetical protein
MFPLHTYSFSHSLKVVIAPYAIACDHLRIQESLGIGAIGLQVFAYTRCTN